MSDDVPESYRKHIDIFVEQQEWYNLTFDFIQHIKDVCNLTLKTYSKYVAHDVEMTILLSNNQKLQDLNYNYSNQDKPTNVLAFPYKQTHLHEQSSHELYLGDIAISYQKLEKESIEMTKSIKEHLTHLIIHGVLHLLGYDHINSSDALVMEEAEKKLMMMLGYNNPYEEDDYNIINLTKPVTKSI